MLDLETYVTGLQGCFRIAATEFFGKEIGAIAATTSVPDKITQIAQTFLEFANSQSDSVTLPLKTVQETNWALASLTNAYKHLVERFATKVGEGIFLKNLTDAVDRHLIPVCKAVVSVNAIAIACLALGILGMMRYRNDNKDMEKYRWGSVALSVIGVALTAFSTFSLHRSLDSMTLHLKALQTFYDLKSTIKL